MNNSLNIYFTDFWSDWKHENFILKILDEFNINKNKSLFDDIYNEPVFTDHQKNKVLSYIDEFKHHLMRIINN